MMNDCKLNVKGIKGKGVEYEIEGDSDSISNALYTILIDNPEFWVIIDNVYHMGLLNKNEM